MKDIRQQLNSAEKKMNKKLYLTTALHSYHKYSKQLADEVSKQVDFINIMTYGMAVASGVKRLRTIRPYRK